MAEPRPRPCYSSRLIRVSPASSPMRFAETPHRGISGKPAPWPGLAAALGDQHHVAVIVGEADPDQAVVRPRAGRGP